MKKFVRAILLMGAIFLLGACGQKAEQKETKKDDADKLSVTIILKEDDKEFDKKELKVKKDESLQTVMEVNYKVDMDKDFVSGIDGHQQDASANKYWLYDVNGKQPDVGAVEYFLKDGDIVTWKLNKL